MSVIYKYPFEIADYATIRMPLGAQVLSSEYVSGQFVLYARVDPAEAATTQRDFRIAGTGHKMESGAGTEQLTFIDTMVDTYSVRGTTLVRHVFERSESRSAEG